MNAQEVFDKVATHLFTQGEPAINENGGCHYFIPENGRSCAVGCLMTPEQGIAADNAGLSSTDVFTIDGNDLLPDELKPHLRMLEDLQAVHDNRRNWDTTWEMRESLRFAALGLTMPVDASILNTLSFKDR